MKVLNRKSLLAITTFWVMFQGMGLALGWDLPSSLRGKSDYSRPWSELSLPVGTGEVVSRMEHITVKKEGGRKKFYDLEEIVLKDQAYYLRFEEPTDKQKSTFIHIRNCGNVIIENLRVVQLDPDYRAYHSVLIEDCDSVLVRTTYFAGTCNYHLRVEGCRNVVLDGVEVAGYDYGELGVRSGGGVWVNNGSHRTTGRLGLWSPNPRDLETLVIENCYIHDNLAEDKTRNNDGILIHSAGNGLLFNNRFERWVKGDSALDVSHRRSDNSYKEKTFRIERNLFIGNKHVKSVGASDVSNSVIWMNNIFVDTKLGNYHQNWTDHHVCETYIFTGKDFGFWRNWGRLGGPVVIEKCLFFLKKGRISSMFKLDNKNSVGALAFIRPDRNIYYMPKDPGFWFVSENRDGSVSFRIRRWHDWQKRGFDQHSQFTRDDKGFAWGQKHGINYVVLQGLDKGDDLWRPVQAVGRGLASKGSDGTGKEPSLSYGLETPQREFFGRPREDWCIGAVCE